MLTLRKSTARGHANHGWLKTFHSFSFADYYDPNHTGFSDLLVINEDYVDAGTGFGRHGHRDMEIITYVLEGELEHRDSMGNGSVLHYGDVQRMSAGTGVQHSEVNPSKNTALHLLQIWITPETRGIIPGYEEKKFSVEQKRNKLLVVASKEGSHGAMKIHQDATLYASILEPGKQLECTLAAGRHAWVQLIRGVLNINGVEMAAGDGLAVAAETILSCKAREESEFLLFDLR